jgi:hypothetical protein
LPSNGEEQNSVLGRCLLDSDRTFLNTLFDENFFNRSAFAGLDKIQQGI